MSVIKLADSFRQPSKVLDSGPQEQEDTGDGEQVQRRGVERRVERVLGLGSGCWRDYHTD
jgi:hypothetical protein